MVENNFHENRPSRDDEFLARVNEEVSKLLASASLKKNIPSATGEGDPLFAFMGSILQWAVEVEASSIGIILGEETVSIQFTRGGVTEQVMTVPRDLHGALTARIKMAADLDIYRNDLPQDGLIPLLCKGIDYEAPVSCRSGEHGESVGIQLIRK